MAWIALQLSKKSLTHNTYIRVSFAVFHFQQLQLSPRTCKTRIVWMSMDYSRNSSIDGSESLFPRLPHPIMGRSRVCFIFFAHHFPPAQIFGFRSSFFNIKTYRWPFSLNKDIVNVRIRHLVGNFNSNYPRKNSALVLSKNCFRFQNCPKNPRLNMLFRLLYLVSIDKDPSTASFAYWVSALHFYDSLSYLRRFSLLWETAFMAFLLCGPTFLKIFKKNWIFPLQNSFSHAILRKAPSE